MNQVNVSIGNSHSTYPIDSPQMSALNETDDDFETPEFFRFWKEDEDKTADVLKSSRHPNGETSPPMALLSSPIPTKAQREIEVELKFEKATVFRSSPGHWMDLNLFETYSNGPWIQGSQIGKGLVQPWGKGGLFPLMPRDFMAVLNPTVKIHLKKEDLDDLREGIQNQKLAAMSIGPIHFKLPDKDLSLNLEHSHLNPEFLSITLIDKSNVPQILGVNNLIMPPRSP